MQKHPADPDVAAPATMPDAARGSCPAATEASRSRAPLFATIAGCLAGFAFLGGLGAGAGVFDGTTTGEPADRTDAPATTKARLAPPSSPDGISDAVAGIYDVISGDAGEARDWERFHAMFTEQALLGQAVRGADGSIQFAHMTPASYEEMATPQFERVAFFERELSREVRVFGEIAQVWSTYASYRTDEADAEPFSRGINSMQFVRQSDGSWKVRSIVWSPETPRSPLPE